MPEAIADEHPVGATISLTGLTKTFSTGGVRIRAVDDITLEFAPGSTTAVTGASGSGKSTMLHLIGAMERADHGSIRVGNVELTTMSRGQLTKYRRGLGFVFQ